ncbi:uncharacterized protein HKW66_Vig0004760 [Vigna angularis]|uniref:Uncharacterized protein n=1 Tax=Phaseolus angularis TaxID=3914 RepID=A0A8T0LE74_PHAAN|nr:uncharacterized protein HKW66_Vig0004760 [Vigna angularis]
MGGRMHTKSDSEVTSNNTKQSSPTRSPPWRPLYYVQSPSNHDVEKMSYCSSPMGSPHHHFHYYLSSPIHHSRESSTPRFSAFLKNPRNFSSNWKKLHPHPFSLRRLLESSTSSSVIAELECMLACFVVGDDATTVVGVDGLETTRERMMCINQQ